MSTASLFIFVVSLLLSGVCSAHPGNFPDETIGLTGIYLMASVEKNGEKLPERHVQGQMVRFTQDRITATDKDSKQIFVATYKLNASTTPWIISMKSVLPQPGLEARGLVKREGDMVWLIYHHAGGQVPTEFKTKDKQLMVVLRKLSK